MNMPILKRGKIIWCESVIRQIVNDILYKRPEKRLDWKYKTRETKWSDKLEKSWIKLTNFMFLVYGNTY